MVFFPEAVRGLPEKNTGYMVETVRAGRPAGYRERIQRFRKTGYRAKDKGYGNIFNGSVPAQRRGDVSVRHASDGRRIKNGGRRQAGGFSV